MNTDAEFDAYLQNEFQWFHAHPELSYKEFATTARLKENLRQANIEILDLPLETGTVAKIGTGTAPYIALRADIDALPITEETDLPYKSQTDGVMHACGHDFHLSAVLGAALLLKEHERDLCGTVFIVFQPAEEAPGGAKKILATNVLKDVQLILGFHSSPLFDVGVIGISAGAVTASVDQFGITFFGKGTHAAHPERGIDPIIMAAQFITAAHSIRGQNLDPASSNIVSITHIESGNTWNVTPASAWLEGTVRSLSTDNRQKIKERIYALAEGIAAAFSGRAKIDWYDGPPATNNDASWATVAEELASAQNFTVLPAPFSLAGEDFAHYQEQLPGLFLIVGTGKSTSNHSPTFRVNPQGLMPTAKYLATLCQTGLRKLNKR